MMLEDYKVPPRSWNSIGQFTVDLRKQFGLNDEPWVPIMELVEDVMSNKLDWFRLEVDSKEIMKGAEGYTCPEGAFIRLREDVYDGAWDGVGRDRFTVAHELGHWAMHTNIPMARATLGDGTPAYEKAEPQANQFAAEFLMPAHFISRNDTAADLRARFQVSNEAASRRLHQLIKREII